MHSIIPRRRAVVALGASAFTPTIALNSLASFAQAREKVWRVGYLTPSTIPSATNRLAALRTGLRDLGYVEGKNLIIDIRAADAIRKRLPELAVELVALKPDVTVTKVCRSRCRRIW